MVASPVEAQSKQSAVSTLISRTALGVLAILGGCCLGMGALYAYSWVFADPGCRCPVERLETSRAFAQRIMPFGIGASALVSAGLFWLSRRVPLATSITSPFFVSMIVALLAAGLAGFAPSLTGRYSNIPLEWLVPEQLLHPVRTLSNTAQSWQFLIFIALWICLYAAIRLLVARRGGVSPRP